MGESTMNEGPRSWRPKLWRLVKTFGWLIPLVLIAQQVWWAPFRADAARARVIERFQQERKSRVIAMIHRQDTQSLFGVPVSQSITIDDSEAILRAIRLTQPEQPLDLILHTPGGLVLAAEQIAKALVEHKGKVTVFVPHYAMSGGTLIALTADEVVMDPNAVLGPVDPQIGGLPAASILKVVALKKPAQVSDEMLVLADVAAKARAPGRGLRGRDPPEAPSKGPGRGPRDYAQRGALDPRLSHHGPGGSPARHPGVGEHAANHLRAHGPLPARKGGPAVGAVRADPPRARRARLRRLRAAPRAGREVAASADRRRPAMVDARQP